MLRNCEYLTTTSKIFHRDDLTLFYLFHTRLASCSTYGTRSKLLQRISIRDALNPFLPNGTSQQALIFLCIYIIE